MSDVINDNTHLRLVLSISGREHGMPQGELPANWTLGGNGRLKELSTPWSAAVRAEGTSSFRSVRLYN